MPRKSNNGQKGFTLIELTVVLGMVAIIAAIATPSWSQLRTRSVLRAAVNDFTSSLQFARSEAVRLNSPVTLCPSSDGVNCTATEFQLGWIVRTGPGANAVDQVILQDTLPRVTVQMDTTTAATRRFTFLPNGLPSNGFAGATMEICPKEASFASLIRSIDVNRTGRTTLSSPGICSL